MTDLSVKLDIADNTDIRYNGGVGGFMSKPLMDQAEEKRVRGLLSLLKTVKPPDDEPAEVREARHEILGLVELCLEKKPIVLEKDLSPTEAGEIAGISRTTVMNLIKSGRLKGYEVGAHWRVTRDSLHKYMADREEFASGMAEMDEHGFGTD